MPSRLKSLELQGYKTFASRTLFEFSDKVTAIVGPNGSGKSNIADSLRWVLGEQSYSLLRGKRTEDMIFSGSEQRPRAGMASASVVFDNDDGWLPIDFTEVAITRRAYRDGENEYLINGQKVRLKDVTELLAQSGLAERTYTIIGQGVVDAALALKPEERRRLFEEAAGIGLHRSRREEALRRLEATRRNLERVQDILAELQPHLRSLERQARRAQEYEGARADLRVLLRKWYGYHWHRAQKDLTEARELAHAQEIELKSARARQSELASELRLSQDQILALRARLNTWHRQQAQLHTSREELSRQLAVVDERIRSIQVQDGQLTSEITRLQEEQGLQADRHAAAQSEVERLANDQAEAERQKEAAKEALQVRQAEYKSVQEKVETARRSLSNQEGHQSALKARAEEQRLQLERQRESLESAGSAASTAQASLDQAQQLLQSLAAAQAELEASRKQAEAELSAHRQRLQQVEGARKTALDQRGSYQAEQARLKAQVEVLQQAEASLSGYASGAQVLLKAIREKRLQGARGALSSHLEVPAELETAIAAALGEYLDAVIIEKSAHYEDALDILSGENARGVLLPLDWLASSPPAENPGDGVLGVAARLVNTRDELRPVVDLLLGNTLVVSDRSAARRALRGQAAGWRAVTLKGEVFFASGPVVAGLEGKPAALSRPRQLKDLDASLQSVQGQVSRVSARLFELDANLQGLHEEEERLTKALNAAQKAEAGGREAHSRAMLELEQLKRQVAWQAKQRQELQDTIRGREAALLQITGELAEAESGLAQGREELQRWSAALAELSLDEYQSQFTYWNAFSSSSGRSLAEARSRLDEQSASLQRAQQALQAGSQRQAALQSELEKSESGRAEMRKAEGKVGRQIDELSAQILPAEKELEAAESGQNELQVAEGLARQALTMAEHHHAQARIGQGHHQEALDAWRQRIMDDFGLVAFDYETDISGPTPLPIDGMVEQLPRLTELEPDFEENLKQQRLVLRRIGPVNPEAQAEFQESRERFDFMTAQVADLQKAEGDVRDVIAELDELMERELRRTFEAVASEFSAIFTRLFGGGSASLILTDPDDVTNTGIDIEARLPGRRSQGLSLLSGGERSLTATSLVFALLKISPTPFCVLDEVDAMLDEANVGRFRELLSELSQHTQFVVVTHNRNTVQAAEVIYGVTMGRDSSSQVISLKLDEVGKVV